MHERRFNEREVKALLERAAEIQAGESEEPSGATLSQIKEAASELGISSEAIEKAALEFHHESIEGRGVFPQNYKQVLVTRMVDGSLSDQSWAEMVSQIKMAGCEQMSAHYQGGSWLIESATLKIGIRATQIGSQTRIEVLERRTPIAEQLGACVAGLAFLGIAGWAIWAQIGFSLGLFLAMVGLIVLVAALLQSPRITRSSIAAKLADAMAMHIVKYG